MEFAKGDPRTRPIFDASKWYGNTSILTAITSNSLQVEEIIADLASKMDSTGDFEISSIKESREKVLTEIVRRRGQPKFRKMLLDAYGGCCAFSGCSVEAVLEAAHIHPYKGPLTNHPQNGLLLRTDLHTLFDLGLLTVNTDNMTIVIDPKLANTEYAQFSGKKLHLPSEISMRPSVDALNAHHHRKGQIVKDLEILNRRADNLNAEAEDVLAYQINNVDC
ncbi:MAG: HNH endonuclease [Acidobacteria bacterium]|nr:HNH endonuclease [Acidobacteriota bacterium]